MSDNISRPLISFALMSYNQERFIRDAVEGAFSQTYTPLEIIISDDQSTDKSFEIISTMASCYQGPHKIILNRNKMNLGIGEHINQIVKLCSGELIVVAAGDDISLPERTQKIFEAYQSTKGRAKSIFSNSIVIDAKGGTQSVHLKGARPTEHFLPERLVDVDFILTGCSHAWSREVFDIFGPILTPLTCEDMVIPFRSALLGDIIYIDEVLIKYRRHEENILWQEGLGNELTRERFFVFEKVAIFNNWLKDLNVLANVKPAEENRIDLLRKRVSKRLIYTQEDILLFNSSWIKRTILLIIRILKGMPLRAVRHRIGVFLIPGIYHKYALLKYKFSLNGFKENLR